MSDSIETVMVAAAACLKAGDCLNPAACVCEGIVTGSACVANPINSDDAIAATVAEIAANVSIAVGVAGDTLGDDTAERVEPCQTIAFPVRYFKAALACVAAKPAEGSEYMSGLSFQTDGTDIRLVAGDDSRVLIASRKSVGDVPLWLSDCVCIPSKGLSARLSLIASTAMDKDEDVMVHVTHSRNARTVDLSDAGDTMTFRISPMDSYYPNVSPVMASVASAFQGREIEAGEAAAIYNPTVLKTASDVATAINGGAVALYSPAGGKTAVATFLNAPGIVLSLQQCGGRASLPALTASVMSPALKGSRAAYLANLTRTETAMESASGEDWDTLSAKAIRLRARIAAIDSDFAALEAPAEAPAAPAPAAPAEAPAAPAKPAKPAKAPAAPAKPAKPAKAPAAPAKPAKPAKAPAAPAKPAKPAKARKANKG